MKPDSRLQTLVPLWAWIPAFRAVAETQHLPSAARLVGVGPSTLSRSIALLEARLGKPLFLRTGRSLRLNPDGEALLVAVRDAMRRLDDGVQTLADPAPRGAVRIASSGAATTAFVAPALAELRARHPGVQPELRTHSVREVSHDLLRGRLDVSFQEVAIVRDGLVTTPIGAVARAVFCGRRHPLFRATRVTPGDLERAEFVAPPPGDDGVVPDGWPPERPRQVAMVVDQLRVGLELCLRLPLLAVLPDVLAVGVPGLRRLPSNLIADSRLYATHRRVLGSRPPLVVQVVELVRARIEERVT